MMQIQTMRTAALLRWNSTPQMTTVQEEDDLLATNRLGRKDINMHSQRMKVFPAAQTSSKSLRKSLKILKEVGLHISKLLSKGCI